MIDNKDIPAVSAFKGVCQWLTSGWTELLGFIESVIRNHPSPRAAITALLVICAFYLALNFLVWLVRRLMSQPSEPKDLRSLSMRSLKAQGSDEWVIELTKKRAEELGLISAKEQRNSIPNVAVDRLEQVADSKGKMIYKHQGKANVKLVFRNPYSSAFNDDTIAMSNKVMGRLGVSVRDGDDDDKEAPFNQFKFRLSNIAGWTPRGLAALTIFHPDPSTALSWRMFIWSTLISLIVTEAYYERSIIDTHTAPKVEVASSSH
jgi:hypothetical protein